LEKYGLNQPDWHKADDPNDDDEDDHRPLSQHLGRMTLEPESYIKDSSQFAANTKSISDSPIKKPVAIRNMVQNNNKRPARFVKPAPQNFADNTIPPEFISIQQLIDAYHNKVYTEGYLEKRNDVTSSGAAYNTRQWNKWYVELCGPVLTLWDASAAGRDIMPQYINITDSTVNIELKLTAETRSDLFSLNSAGANRYLLQAPSTQDLEQWVKAIRLSCFECARIQEIYTYVFMTRSLYQSKSMHSTPPTKYNLERTSGFVQVRFPGATGWKKFWAVVSDKLIQKSLFSKKIVQTQGQVMFYESKKAKRPVMTLTNVVQAYTVYPESPKLIQRATLFKLEGSLYKARSNGGQPLLVSPASSALIMASTTDELVQWLVGIYDIFKLYGRPNQLLNDPSNKESLDFGKQMNRATRGRLFLELSESSTVNVNQGTNLLDTKKAFNSLLVEKIASVPNIDDIPELEIPTLTPQDTAVITTTVDDDHHNSQPVITTTAPSEKRMSVHSTTSGTGSTSHDSTKSRAKTLPTPLRNGLSAPTLLRNVTYASDMSDDDEEEQDVEEEDNSDSDDSVFNLRKKKNNKEDKQQELAIVTTATSKSSTEISEASSTATVPMILPLINKMPEEEDTTFSDSILNSIRLNTQQQPMQSTNKISKKATAASSSNQYAPSQANTLYSQNTNQHKRNSRFGPKAESNNSHTSLSSSIHTSSDTTLVSQSSQSPDGKLSKNPAKAPMTKKQQSNQKHTRPPINSQWPMFTSTTSIQESDYTPSRSQSNWETASVDPNMMGGAHRDTFFSSSDSFQAPFYAASVMNGDGRSAVGDDDDDVPIANTYINQHSLQDRLGNSPRSPAKRMENNTRLKYQPLTQKKPSPRGSGGMPHKTTLLEEQAMMQERMLLEQRQQMMMQQVHLFFLRHIFDKED
jgi:hypothetical protein